MRHPDDDRPPHWLWPSSALEAAELCWADRYTGNEATVACRRTVTDHALGLCALHSARLRGPGADITPPQGR